MARTQQSLQEAFIKSKLTEAELAARIGVDEIEIRRRFKSNTNLSVREIGELVGALGFKARLYIERADQ